MKILFFYAVLLMSAVGLAEDQVSVVVNGTTYYCSANGGGGGGGSIRLNPGRYRAADGSSGNISDVAYLGVNVASFYFELPSGGAAKFTCQYVSCDWAGRNLTILDANNIIFQGRDYARSGS